MSYIGAYIPANIFVQIVRFEEDADAFSVDGSEIVIWYKIPNWASGVYKMLPTQV